MYFFQYDFQNECRDDPIVSKMVFAFTRKISETRNVSLRWKLALLMGMIESLM